jgi:hypothetical protein
MITTVIIFLIGGCLCAYGLRPVGEAVKLMYEIQSISDIPVITGKSLLSAPLGQYGIVEGQVSHQNSSYQGESQDMNKLVIYKIFRRSDKRVTEVTPPFWLNVEGGQIHIRNSDYRVEYREFPRPDTYNEDISYNGYAFGSNVLVFGTVSQDDMGRAIQANLIAIGPRSRYIAARQDSLNLGAALVLPRSILPTLLGLPFIFVGIRRIYVSRRQLANIKKKQTQDS